jgi:hypothetical protein
MEDNSKYSQILQYLKTTFFESDNDIRKQAEASLFELRKIKLILETNLLEHIQDLLQLFQIPDLENKLKTSITIYLKNLIKSKLESKTLQKESVIEILRAYITFYLTGTLKDQLLQNLNLQLQDILNSHYVVSDINIVIQLLDYLNNILTSSPDNLVIYKPICYILQIIISCSCTNSQNIYDLLPKQIVMIDFMFTNVKRLLASVNEDRLLLDM